MRFSAETKIQRKMRELKDREIMVLADPKHTVTGCINRLITKTVKMLQAKLGTSLTTRFVEDELTKEPKVEVIFERPLPALKSEKAEEMLLEDRLTLTLDSDFDLMEIAREIK